jgi:outer membrane lipoprotein
VIYLKGNTHQVACVLFHHLVANEIFHDCDYMFTKMVIIHNINKICFLLVLLASITVAGCSSIISPELKSTIDYLITFPEVAKDPDAYKGRLVLWGGNIVRTIHQDEGTTLIEIVQRPLGMNEEPQDVYLPEGAFLVSVDKHLDPSLYHAGREVTVAGQILGKKTMLSGNIRHQYPLISSEQLYLWRDRNNRYLPPEYFQQYPPDYDDLCFYAPWWWCDF